jgi:sodium-dependent dicarboxylate transporter 2/3/5
MKLRPTASIKTDARHEAPDLKIYSLPQKIGLIAGPLLFLIIFFSPPLEGLSPSAQRVGAVAIWMSVWWLTEALSLYATALLPLVLFPLLGIAEPRQAAAPYAEPTVFLFMGGFFLAVAMQRWELHKRIALVILHRLGHSPRRLLFGFMLATSLISMWVSNTATTMMLFPIGLALITRLEDPKRQSPFGTALMLGIAYAASIGGVGTLIGTAPNAIFVGQARQLFPNLTQIDFLHWMLIGLPYVFVFLPLAWLYLTFVTMRSLKEPEQRSFDLQQESSRLGSLSRGEWGVMLVFALTVLGWVFRSDLQLGSLTVPGWSNFFGIQKWVDDSTVAILSALLLFVIPVNLREGIFLLNWDWAKKIPWGILVLFGGGFALADAFQKTGLAAWVGGGLQGLAELPLFLLILLICLTIVFMSEIASNTALTVMMMPILGATATALNIHPYLLMLPATIAASSGFMLPVATPPNAIVFSSGYITQGQMAKAGFMLDLLGALLATLVIYFIAVPLWGLK